MRALHLPAVPTAARVLERAGTVRRHPVVVVGAGPIGLDRRAWTCAPQGHPVVLLDDNNTVSIGSRAVCYAKRPLEIWDRLGCGAPMVDKGRDLEGGQGVLPATSWASFDPLPEAAPDAGMINLQQYYLEEFLAARRASRCPWSTCAGSTG